MSGEIIFESDVILIEVAESPSGEPGILINKLEHEALDIAAVADLWDSLDEFLKEYGYS